MLNSLRTLMFVGAIILGYQQYHKELPVPTPNPSPNPPVVTPDRLELIIGTETETFPQRPSEGLVEALQGLEEVVTNKDDALKLARAFKHWAKLLSKEELITNLTKYQEIRAASIRALFMGGEPLSKDYKGLIEPKVKIAYKHVLQKFYVGETPPSDVTPEVRKALVELNEALSWKFSSIWLEKVMLEELAKPEALVYPPQDEYRFVPQIMEN